MCSPPRRSGWSAKFRNAASGIFFALRTEKSFYVHLPVGGIVLALGVILKLETARLALLVVCVGLVIGAELFNTSLEYLARAITKTTDENIGRALDVASGAVLFVTLVAVAIGGIIFMPVLNELIPR